MGDGPQQVHHACQGAFANLAGVLELSAVAGSRAAWADAAAAAQRVINAASAVQDAAIAHLAAIEPHWLEDGTEVQTHHALGHTALDSPAILAGALTVAEVHAQRRVRAAVRLAADGPTGTPTHTGLAALHTAMRTGRLDPYRAGVLADELDAVPAQVAAAVIAALQPFLDTDDGAHLRRRARRHLARISPDLLRQRARRARAECSLRRWADQPGIDKWEGTFPSEDAAHAWAAIDTLAHRYVNDGTSPTIERARAQALTDLVTGNATVDYHVTLTAPADLTTPNPTDTSTGNGDPVDDTDPTDAADTDTDTEASGPAPAHAADTYPADTDPSATADNPRAADTDPSAPASPAGGQSAPAPADPQRGSAFTRARPAPPDPCAWPAHDPDDLVEVGGLRAGDKVLVPRGWLDAVLAAAAATGTITTRSCHPVTGALLDDPQRDRPPRRSDTHPGAATPTRPPAPGTTARPPAADPGATVRPPAGPPAPGTPAGPAGPGAYRPSARLAALVKARDGRCRFPGCTINARFCDLDHVRPWPTGPTTAQNLICLCRRHHRIKQRPGWTVSVTPDAVTTWTDPTGRVRTTAPIDALHTTVLPHPTRSDPHDNHGTHSPGHDSDRYRDHGDRDDRDYGNYGDDHAPMLRPRTVIPDGPHSHLEFHLEHHTVRAEHDTARGAHRSHRTRPLPRAHHGIHLAHATRWGTTIEIDPDTHHWPHPHPHPHPHQRDRSHDDDPPPF